MTHIIFDFLADPILYYHLRQSWVNSDNRLDHIGILHCFVEKVCMYDDLKFQLNGAFVKTYGNVR